MRGFASALRVCSRLVFCKIGCWGFNKILENLQPDLLYGYIIDIVSVLDIHMVKSITKQELPSEVGFLTELVPPEWKPGVP